MNLKLNKMLYKKSQSAMEYLMTYGWAILVVLIALGVLYYLGVFNPKVPNICQIEAPFTCQDVKLVDGGPDLDPYDDLGASADILYMSFGASTFTNVEDVLINIQGQVGESLCGNINIVSDLNKNKGGVITIVCASQSTTVDNKDVKYTGEFIIEYSKAGGLSHSIKGTFSGVSAYKYFE